MNDLITIGLPSKGRLKEKSLSFFSDSGLKIIQSERERNYFGTIENNPNIKIQGHPFSFEIIQLKYIRYMRVLIQFL